MTKKSNKNISIEKDDTKSYVYIKDKNKDVGYLYWNSNLKRWLFVGYKKKRKKEVR